MQIVTRDAAQKLDQFLARIADLALAWRASVVRMPSGLVPITQVREEVKLQLVVNLLQKHLEDEASARLFFLEEGDIVILSPGERRQALRNLSEEFRYMFPAEQAPQDVILHDLSIDYDTMRRYSAARAAVEVERANARKEKEKPLPEGPRPVRVDMDVAREALARRPSRKGLVVQLAEDDMFTLKLVEKIFADYTVVRASDGVSAVETYFMTVPDIVFLDINMPHMNGHDVLRRIMAFDKDAFVVMLTGNSYMADVTRAINAGARGFVTKPFPKEKLLSYVKICQAERLGKK